MGILLKNRCLVLNKSWSPIGIISLQRAITLLCSYDEKDNPKAKIIDGGSGSYQLFSWNEWSKLIPSENELFIQSSHTRYRVPEIIILTGFDKIPSPRVHFSRSTIFKRDNYICQYCGKKVDKDSGTIDHILPRAQGGVTSWTNCILACMGCNSQKADRRPEQAFRTDKNKNWNGPSPMKLMSIPKKPKFNLIKYDKGQMPKSWTNFIQDGSFHE